MSLPAILANTQTPHQPFLIICDTPTLPAHTLVRDLVRRNIADASPVAFVSVLHPPSTYGLDSSNANVRILDLTDDAERYYSDSPRDTFTHLATWLRDTVDQLGRGVQVYIDALDVLVEDYASPSRGIKIIKTVLQSLRAQKAPSRLILPLPSSTPLLNALLTPSTSPTLTLLTLHPPTLIAHLAETYLTTPSGSLDADPQGMKFWALLNASDGPGSAGWAGGQAGDVKGKGRARGESLVRCLMSDSDDTADAAAAAAVVVQVLVRKQQGGANKGMSRGLDAVRVTAKGMLPCAWNEVEGLQSLRRGYVPEPEPVQEHHPSQQHIPFNLSLTASQQASRAAVPIPYAHEGDEPPMTREPTAVGGGIIFEPGSEDDMDDDDPDEDLDF